ncbi:MAG: EAL domain-containing protein [Bacillota bacterium]
MNSDNQNLNFKKIHNFFFHNVPLPTLKIDKMGSILGVNKAMEKLTNYLGGELRENGIRKLLLDDDRKKLLQAAKKTAQNGEKTNLEAVIITKNGQQIPVQITLFNREKEAKQNIYLTAHDISQRKNVEKKLYFFKNYDPLTGLPNREFFTRLFRKYLEEKNQNEGDLSAAILFIDLDHFKKINNSFGHRIGDRVLQKASLRLRKCTGKQDIISRSGGDEFSVLLTSMDSKDRVTEVAEKIIEEFSRPYNITDHKFYVTPSIGISIYPEHGKSLRELLNNANRAMTRVKLRGKNHYLFYRPENKRKVNRRIYLENEMRQALEEDNFQLYYQPQINLSTRKIVGMEALIRWEHSDMGFISPRNFIPVAEETGLIIPIGEWVLKNACKQSNKWQKISEDSDSIKIAVNISIRQFQQGNITHILENIISHTGLNPRMLELEITERIMRNIKKLALELKKLKDLGVRLSIDDFGTGYSSLNILNNLPLDTLKIDQSFISGITRNQNTASLVKTIINMGDNLNYEVIAEGIEKKTQATFLQLNRCNTGQGYYFSRPLPPGLLEKKIDIKNWKLPGKYYS